MTLAQARAQISHVQAIIRSAREVLLLGQGQPAMADAAIDCAEIVMLQAAGQLDTLEVGLMSVSE